MSHSYSSDISREQFARILPCLESARRRTKPRTVDLYDVFCGVLYLLKGWSTGKMASGRVSMAGPSVRSGFRPAYPVFIFLLTFA